MELNVLDPFGDYATEGYLRNVYKEKDLSIIGHLETAAFEDHVHDAVEFLRAQSSIEYSHITETHRILFESVYPWAGRDRLETAPHLAIARGGYSTLFSHPAAIRKAVDVALHKAGDAEYFLSHPGEIFGYLAHAHPFLEGNGRTILTVFTDLTRRCGFHISWEEIDKARFLDLLTKELLEPGKHMDSLVIPYVHKGVLSGGESAKQLTLNFNRESD
jgi:cell filamentation protein